jgi:transcriptional regulator with XRE-family HTH domain
MGSLTLSIGLFLAQKGKPVAEGEEWPPKEQFRDRLARLRKARGVSNKQIAKAAGVAVNTVSNWMGDQVPEGQVLLDLAAFFDVPAQWFLTGEKRRPVGSAAPTKPSVKRESKLATVEEEVAAKPNPRKRRGRR